MNELSLNRYLTQLLLFFFLFFLLGQIVLLRQVLCTKSLLPGIVENSTDFSYIMETYKPIFNQLLCDFNALVIFAYISV